MISVMWMISICVNDFVCVHDFGCVNDFETGLMMKAYTWWFSQLASLRREHMYACTYYICMHVHMHVRAYLKNVHLLGGIMGYVCMYIIHVHMHVRAYLCRMFTSLVGFSWAAFASVLPRGIHCIPLFCNACRMTCTCMCAMHVCVNDWMYAQSGRMCVYMTCTNMSTPGSSPCRHENMCVRIYMYVYVNSIYMCVYIYIYMKVFIHLCE